MRRNILTRLHDSHRGVEATKRRAKQTVYWPGINSDIANTVHACEPCQIMQPSQQQEPWLCNENPSRPFESVSADFFSVAGKSFLVYVDRLSGWPVVVKFGTNTTAEATTRHFSHIFRDLGVPVRLMTDGGPQFTSSEFKNFLGRWGVQHVMSTPHYPQSNGHAEVAVKKVKHFILKVAPSGNIDTEDFDRGLLEIRNTPNYAGRSPAQILYGQALRSCVPAHASSFKQEWQAKAEEYDRRVASCSQAAKIRYDSHAHPLAPLKLDDNVRIQDPISKRWDKTGVIMGIGKSRDYHVKLPSGRILWRNRRFLRPVHLPNSQLRDEMQQYPKKKDVAPATSQQPQSDTHLEYRRSPRLHTRS
ncbi:uncharacterized protein K02A2.6-like [Macrobrachium nipponense]|uniref:uncharacterized protein K02A2.6-like n=1 Tax=Macrobrachium nipponense TaxID=159736 RepID=UPI0030C7FAB2